MDRILAKDGREHTHGRDLGAELVERPVDTLRPHPTYVRHHLTVPAAQLSALAAEGETVFDEPLQITHDGIVLGDYARLELARLRGRPTLLCISFYLTEEEALHRIIRRHGKANIVNDFTRILLALELEPWLKQSARLNQQVGGLKKGSSNLTEAERLDVRSEIAKLAGVCAANVSKVKKLLGDAKPELLQALREGEVSIHRASGWLGTPEKQLEQLSLHQNLRGITKTIDFLLQRHRAAEPASNGQFDVRRIGSALAALDDERRSAVVVHEIQLFGQVLLLSRDLSKALKNHGDLSHEQC